MAKSKKVERANMTMTNAQGKVLREPKKNLEDLEGRFYWWKADEYDMARQIAGTIKFISTHQSSRLEQLTVSTRLYGNSSVFTMIGTMFNRGSANTAAPNSQRISFNLCSSVVDTLTAKIAKNKVIPTFITNGGVWGMQKKAEQLSKFVEGIFYGQKIHYKGTMAFRDAAVWGDGILHICEQNDEIYVERVLPHEILVDQIESMSADPRQMHRVKVVDRGILMDLYPDYAKEIENAMPAAYQDVGGSGTAADLVTVTESWHLRSGPDAEDGVHAICLDDTVLFYEMYDKDYFPFVFLNYSKRLLGFWSQGACERLQSLQGEVNRLMILIQRSMWMGGSFKILLENGSKVVSQHLNNDVGTIIHYSGSAPQYITPPMIQQDIYPYVDSLIAKGYQQEGVSQLSAASMKPLGLDSGKALRAMTDIEADRQLFVGQIVEDFYLEVARQCIEVAKDIYERTNTYSTVFPSTRFMETVDWKDIQLEADQYVLKAFPTSSLKDDMSGRLQDVQDLAQAGMISPRTARKLLRMPDLEMADNLANAAEDLLSKIFEDMLDDGKYRAPEPFMDLLLAKQLCMEYYNYADYQNAPESRLSLLRKFSAQIDDLTGANQPPPPAPMPPGPGAGPGVAPANPTATPVSPMLPNVNGRAA